MISLPSTDDRARDLDQRLEPDRVDRDHAVDRLAGLRLPHLRRERRVGREARRHREVAPLLARVGPAPAGREVARRPAPRPRAPCRSPVSVIGPRSNWPFCMVMTPALSSIPEPARISALFAASTRYFDGPWAICAMPFDASSTSIIDVADLAELAAELARGRPAAGRAAPGSGRGRGRAARPRALAAIAPSSSHERDPVRARRSSARSSRLVDASIASTPTRTTLAAELGERVDRPDLAADERAAP